MFEEMDRILLVGIVYTCLLTDFLMNYIGLPGSRSSVSRSGKMLAICRNIV